LPKGLAFWVGFANPLQFFFKWDVFFQQNQLHFVVIVAGAKATEFQHERSPNDAAKA
jgi:hypothetical protein